MDYNREVRRATHDTMTSLVGAAGFVPVFSFGSFHFFIYLIFFLAAFLSIYKYVLLVISKGKGKDKLLQLFTFWNC